METELSHGRFIERVLGSYIGSEENDDGCMIIRSQFVCRYGRKSKAVERAPLRQAIPTHAKL